MKTISISIKNWRRINKIRQDEEVKHSNDVISGLLDMYDDYKVRRP